ncbi:hypothetical protein TREMEDRAFT_39017 [Tremella mesenterica DSM 1558]|uniref:uncharacterized protein n=1 Tax=Tremella mesenterica (strain ATCC 24925 / CBS 8224 / DSM 1558 / NBRC 9311 / NRRL Y-6157 / RJB 2259-6 / UBC 559-6) TaxID=578456 RepID=UPI0003F4A2AA|nr:uncharacterized protein TREMEDRAFT_39017 [Tremella mesenterica DSM 1558]EIW69421.1 hypothetical protein TREMEDRAFT_39017 [Tremella mesenterica DSM 1558]
MNSETIPLLPPSPKPHHNLAGLSPSRFRLVCFFVWFGAFLASLDGTIVATLLTPIGSYFDSSNRASWLGTSYLLSLCCFTPIYGRLSDLIGRRITYVGALSLFFLGTILCAIAPSMEFLFARCVAGMGGGGVQSIGVVIMTDLVSLRQRGLFQGYANIAFGLGGAVGGPIGGLISDTLGWRASFTFQLPLMIICAIGIFITLRHVHLPIKPTLINPQSISTSSSSNIPSSSSKSGFKATLRRIDYLGSLTLVIALGSLLVSISIKTSSLQDDGTDYPWSDPLILGLLLNSILFFTLFSLVETRWAAEPTLPFQLLSRRTPFSVAFTSFTMVFNQFSLLYNVPLFFSAVKLRPASISGAHLLPYSLVGPVGSVGMGWIIRHTGRYWWCSVIGGLIMVISAGMMCFWKENSPGWLSWVSVAPAGAGYAGVLTSSLIALMTEVTRQGRGEIAVATSMSYLFRTSGQVLGVSISAAIVQSILQKDLSRLITGPDASEIIYTIRHSTSSIVSLPEIYRTAAVNAYQHALHVVFIVNFAFTIITVFGLALVKEEDMPEQQVTPVTPTTVSRDDTA